jgi:hypothetical protein
MPLTFKAPDNCFSELSYINNNSDVDNRLHIIDELYIYHDKWIITFYNYSNEILLHFHITNGIDSCTITKTNKINIISDNIDNWIYDTGKIYYHNEMLLEFNQYEFIFKDWILKYDKYLLIKYQHYSFIYNFANYYYNKIIIEHLRQRFTIIYNKHLKQLALVKLNWNKANDKYSLVLQHSICYLKYKTKNASLNMLLQYVENKLVPYSIIVRKKGRKEIITYDNYSFLIKDLQQNFILNVEYQKLLHNFYQGKLQNKLLLNLYDSLQKNLPANSLQQLLLN